MLTNVNPYHMQWNVDVYGNPTAIHREEKQQVSSVYFDIQLEEIPDQYHRLVVKDKNENMLHETMDRLKLTPMSYFVDYNNGVVYFHEDNGGMVFDILYYGRGFRRINASRIAFDDGTSLSEMVNSLSTLSVLSDQGSNTFVENRIKGLSEIVTKQQKQIDLLIDAIEELQAK